MKDKILDVIAKSILVLLMIAAITGIVIGFINDPIAMLSIISIVLVIFIIVWAVFRVSDE